MSNMNDFFGNHPLRETMFSFVPVEIFIIRGIRDKKASLFSMEEKKSFFLLAAVNLGLCFIPKL